MGKKKFKDMFEMKQGKKKGHKKRGRTLKVIQICRHKDSVPLFYIWVFKELTHIKINKLKKIYNCLLQDLYL